MSKKTIFYIVFFAVLVFGFYFFLMAQLPQFARPKLAILSTVQPFRFVNQDGDTVTEAVLQNKVAVVNFFFTTCTVVCPKMNGNLKPVYEQYRGDKRVVFLSHTSDPERDSVPVLKRYADSMGVDTGQWIFLTGRKDSLYNAARHSYAIDDPQNFVQNIDDDFMHTQFVALVNTKGEVVNVYDGIKPTEIKKLQEDLARLLQ